MAQKLQASERKQRWERVKAIVTLLDILRIPRASAEQHISKTPCLKLRDIGHTYGHFPGYDVAPASKVLRLLDKIRGR